MSKRVMRRWPLERMGRFGQLDLPGSSSTRSEGDLVEVCILNSSRDMSETLLYKYQSNMRAISEPSSLVRVISVNNKKSRPRWAFCVQKTANNNPDAYASSSAVIPSKLAVVAVDPPSYISHLKRKPVLQCLRPSCA